MEAVVAIAAAAALAQAYQSQQAQGASKAQLAQIKASFDALKPPGYNISVMDPPAFIQQQPPPPNFDMSKLTPEQFKVIGQYAPNVAPYIAEKNPQLVTSTADMQTGRQAELTALQKLKETGSLDQDPELAQSLAQAGKSAQVAAQSRQASILQDEARRGNMGAGTALAAELQGGSDAMSRAASESQNAAALSYKNKIGALMQSGQLGSQVRGEDQSLQAANAGIVNDFNARTARNAQGYADRTAGVQNDAQLKNLEAGQRVADANTENDNRFAVDQQSRGDRLQQYLQGLKQQQLQYQNSIIGAQADWQRGERNNQNQLLNQQYTDLFNKTAAGNNIGLIQNNQNLQFAQDKNSQIQGLGNAAASGYMYSDSQDRADKRAAQYNGTGAYDQQGDGYANGYDPNEEEQ